MSKNKKESANLSKNTSLKDPFISVASAKTVTDKYGNKINYPEIVWIKPENFGVIKKLKYNRDVLKAMVAKLGISITELGVLRAIILVRYKYEYYGADGQHLLEHAKKAGIPLYAFIVPIEDEDEAKIMNILATLNNVVRRWSLTQYAKNWQKFLSERAELGDFGAYDRLNELKDVYDISFTLLGALMYCGTQSEAKKAIRDGKFEEKQNPARLDKALAALENFHFHTGVPIKGTHSASGLSQFIISDIGLDKYLLNESRFIDAVKTHQNTNRISGFSRASDSNELWNKLYKEMK